MSSKVIGYRSRFEEYEHFRIELIKKDKTMLDKWIKEIADGWIETELKRGNFTLDKHRKYK